MSVIHTYSSPSVENWPLTSAAGRSDYPPPEQPRAMERVFKALRPVAVVVSRSDLWPELACGAYNAGVPVAVVGGLIRPASLRLRWPVRRALESLYRRLAFVGAVSSGDADRWIRLGAPPDVVRVTGDPRDDHVLERKPTFSTWPLLPWAAAGPTLVAGSTHPQDERILIEALMRLRVSRPDARLIIAPHEADPDSMARMFNLTAKRGLLMAAWNGGTPSSEVRVLVVTRQGILADVYQLGSVAYVGGGFRNSGVHSLVEPAAYALATLTGPTSAQDESAKRFLSSGGVVAIDATDPVRSLTERWEAWLVDTASRTEAGLAARGQLQEGSASRTADALATMLELS